MMILETVLSDRYVCQISSFSPQVKYLGEFFMLAATLCGKMELVDQISGINDQS
jgi:hypothetical protein